MVVMVGTYADESENRKAGIYTLAGWTGEPAAWDRLTPLWNQMIADAPHPISEFHMVDIAHGANEFAEEKGWTQAERNALVIRATDILVDVCGDRELAGYACTVFQSELEWLDESPEQLWKCCYGAFMHMVGIGMVAYGFRGLDFVFDSKEKVRGHVEQFFWPAKDELDKDPRLKGLLQGTSFKSSASLAPLQAADFLAYEKCKRASDRVCGSDRLRKSYERLCQIPHRFVAMDGNFRAALNEEMARRDLGGQPDTDAVFRCL